MAFAPVATGVDKDHDDKGGMMFDRLLRGRLLRGLPHLAGAALLIAALAGPATAETDEVRIAQQYGISYLPLTVMNHEKLLEAAAAKAGIAGLKVTWSQFGAGNAMNEALLSGNLDLASGGVAPLLTIWSKTKGRQDVKAVASLNSMPLYLNVIDPNIKTLKDITEKDKIALPAAKSSIQAVTLQMAAEQAFGPGQWAKLDPRTISMAHPDAMAAMLSGRSEIVGHFGSPPFQTQELEDKRVHRLLNSYDVLGGPATFNVVWAQKKFHDDNPKVYGAFLAALTEAMNLIKAAPSRAASIYIDAEKSKMPVAAVEQLIRDPENVFTTTPQNIMKYARFMHKIGTVENLPASWKDLFFPEIHAASGS
jgi:NitT/TauT family transport system substrate-binding protein